MLLECLQGNSGASVLLTLLEPPRPCLALRAAAATAAADAAAAACALRVPRLHARMHLPGRTSRNAAAHGRRWCVWLVAPCRSRAAGVRGGGGGCAGGQPHKEQAAAGRRRGRVRGPGEGACTRAFRTLSAAPCRGCSPHPHAGYHGPESYTPRHILVGGRRAHPWGGKERHVQGSTMRSAQHLLGCPTRAHLQRCCTRRDLFFMNLWCLFV